MNWLAVGAVFAFLGVVLGAFGGHLLKQRLPEDRFKAYEIGTTYQMYHALALIGTGILQRFGIGSSLMSMAGWLFAIGTVLFSGSLYILSLSGKRVFGAITPFGGLCFLAGWVIIVVGVIR